MAKKKRDSSPGTPSPTGGVPTPAPTPSEGGEKKGPISSGSGYYSAGAQPVAPAPVYKSDYYSGQQSGGVYAPYGDGVSQSSGTMAEGQVSQSSATHAGDLVPMDKEQSIKALIGRTIDRYKILKLLGEGGFGAVYKAEHTLMKRDVAFKTLHRELGKDPAVLHRFKKEGQVASRFKHKNCIELYDFGQMDDGTYFMAMEFLPGKDLREVLKKKGALELGECFDIMIQTLAGLQGAHEGGVIHRDLKPDNIKLEEREGRTDFVKILDFGISKIIDKDMPEIGLDKQTGKLTDAEATKIVQDMGPVENVDPAESGFKTQVGAFFGTPEYGSPEQCAGEEIDARSDIYTMGVILYELLTGSLPFVSKTPQGYLAQHMVAPPRPITEIRPDLKIPAEVEAIIMKSLEKRREDRYQNCNEMAQAMIEAAQKCGIAITVEGGGTVVIKTPTWKLALMIGMPMLVIAVSAYIVLSRMKDPLFAAVQTTYTNYMSAHQYEQAKDFLTGADDEVRKNHWKYFTDELVKVEAKMAARQAKFDAVIARVDTEFLAVPPAARTEYDPVVENLNSALRDEEAIGDLRTKLEDKANAVMAAREADARAQWDENLKQIGDMIEQLQFPEAKAVCDNFPVKFKSAKAVQDDIQSKKTDIDRVKATTPDGEFKALAALNDAKKYRADNARDWPGQLDLLNQVVKTYPGLKATNQAILQVIPMVTKEFEDTGKKELDAIKIECNRLLALNTREGLDKAYATWKSWPEVFQKTTEARAAYEAYKQVAIDGEATKRWSVASHKADQLREGYKPEVANAEIVAWTSFSNHPRIQGEAVHMVASLEKAVKQHEDMQEIPASTKVQVGEPMPASISGPIQPAHPVKAFKIDRAEVTNQQYWIFLEDNYRGNPAEAAKHTPAWWAEGGREDKGLTTYPAGLDDHPVRMVSFNDAELFARWVGKRLPDEYEWEYAARGESYYSTATEKHDYPWGTIPQRANWQFFCRWSYEKKDGQKTAKVKSYENGKSVPFGLYDMAGNVAEWTTSPFIRYEGSKAPPDGRFGTQYRVVRGGSYGGKFEADRGFNNISACRCAFRDAYLPDSKPEDVGFRCVKPVEVAAATPK